MECNHCGNTYIRSKEIIYCKKCGKSLIQDDNKIEIRGCTICNKEYISGDYCPIDGGEIIVKKIAESDYYRNKINIKIIYQKIGDYIEYFHNIIVKKPYEFLFDLLVPESDYLIARIWAMAMIVCMFIYIMLANLLFYLGIPIFIIVKIFNIIY